MKNFLQLKKIINSHKISEDIKSYKLLDNAFSSEDILAGTKVLLSRQITMSKITEKFEKEFAEFVGARFAVMVNSGSSANLLAVSASCNPLRDTKFYPGDEAIIPVLCWSTSLWPLVQFGLKPIFVDIDQGTLNINVEKLISKINSKTKLVMMVHVLGYSSDIQKIRNICKKKKIILIEDTCESLGSKFNNKYLGTFGDFGTYSFYYSHQITCGEGGMVVCNSFNDYKLLYALRAHGWARGPNQLKKNSTLLKKLDSRFVFINSGFNLRPTDLAASIASSQLKRLDYFIKIRDQNRNKIIKKITLSKKWKNQFIFLDKVKNLKPSWFGLPILLNKKYQKIKIKFTKYLERAGIENRPIISGNFLNQPSAKLYKLNDKNDQFPNADEVENRGFFIGLHTKPINKRQLDLLEKCLLNIDKFMTVKPNSY
jgi:CDP-6-deoxy-D-xylo-4-hexulose-3-dehydrase